MAFLIPLAAAAIGSGISAYSQNRRMKKDAKTGRDTRQLPLFSPQQQQYQSQVLGQLKGPTQGGLSYLQNLYSDQPGAFEQFEAPYKRQFEEQTVPKLAERFSGTGAGAQSSSAFQQALAQQGASLSENLAALRGGLRQSALGHLQNFGQLGLKSPFENVYLGSQPGFGENFGSQLAAAGGRNIDTEAIADMISKWFTGRSDINDASQVPEKNNFTNQPMPRF
jgi:hypothetical protein